MYADCVASTSRLAFEDIWDPPVFERFFPVSDCRYESRVPDTLPQRASTTPHLQAPSKPSANVLQPAATTSYSTTLPTRTQISPGVFADGRNLVFSSAHPEVQSLLAAARSSLTLPKPSSEVIFALSALEVFYKPADPAHWLFWSDDKKFATADVVTRISLHNPPLIISSVAWNGKPEYLAILATHHGISWRQFYETEPWFTIVVPPKPSTPPRQLNLRKRKVPAGAFKEASAGLEEIDEDDLLPGRADSRAPSPQPMNDTDAPAPKKRVQRSRAARTKPKAPTPSPPPSLPPSPPASILTLSPEQMSADVDSAAAVAAGMAEAETRSRRKITLPSRYPQSASYAPEAAHGHLLLHPPLEASLLLGPGIHPGQGIASMALLPGPGVPGHGTHARTRSTSTDFSGKTAVGSGSSRSASVASGASTAVDAGSPSKKRKALEEDADLLEGGLDLGDVEMDGDDDTESVSVALGRSKRYKKPNALPNVDDAIALSEKGRVAKAAAAPRASRKKARKA